MGRPRVEGRLAKADVFDPDRSAHFMKDMRVMSGRKIGKNESDAMGRNANALQTNDRCGSMDKHPQALTALSAHAGPHAEELELQAALATH